MLVWGMAYLGLEALIDNVCGVLVVRSAGEPTARAGIEKRGHRSPRSVEVNPRIVRPSPLHPLKLRTG